MDIVIVMMVTMIQRNLLNVVIAMFHVKHAQWVMHHLVFYVQFHQTDFLPRERVLVCPDFTRCYRLNARRAIIHASIVLTQHHQDVHYVIQTIIELFQEQVVCV